MGSGEPTQMGSGMGMSSMPKMTQVHDYNPGTPNATTGLFWTTTVPRDAVRVLPDDQTAVLEVQNLALNDFGTLADALGGKTGVPGTVSFRIEWSGRDVIERQQLESLVDNFKADFMQTVVSAQVSASTPGMGGFTFKSDPGSTKTHFAIFGREQNGSYFRPGGR